MRNFLIAIFVCLGVACSAQDLDSIFKSLDLQEVVVKAKKIRHSGDTINYSASAYLSKEDKVLEDLLKKMPGISISADGQISYNGKWITEFYIEGTDMLGGRYNIATTNINAEDVAAVQVMEHHQDAKVLQGTQRGDNPAINIKLKNIAKGIWASSLDAEVGTPALARRATINLMNFKPQRHFSVKPYANFNYKPNSHFDYNLLASYEESLPSATQQLTASYYQNYRTTYANTCQLEAGLQRTFKTSASVSYKDVIRMLFANASLTYVNTHSQHSTAYRFVDDVTDYYLLPVGSDNCVYQIDQTFSKGFFKFNSKIQESITIGRSNGEYLIDDVQHNSRTDYLKASVNYNASFTKWLSLMTNNTLSISKPYTDGFKGKDLYRTFTDATSVILWVGSSFSFNTQMQYYYNSYFTQGRSNLFLNERIEYHLKSTIFSLECINLFDHKTYNRIIDNGVTRYVSQYQLRGRTVMAGIRIKLL